jgi:hypothetical protein
MHKSPVRIRDSCISLRSEEIEKQVFNFFLTWGCKYLLE